MNNSKHKSLVFSGSINLDKISEENIYIDAEGTRWLNFKGSLYAHTNNKGEDGLLSQRFLKENIKDEEGNYKKTPIIANFKVIRNFDYEK
jgi:hypothetical protein